MTDGGWLNNEIHPAVAMTTTFVTKDCFLSVTYRPQALTEITAVNGRLTIQPLQSGQT